MLCLGNVVENHARHFPIRRVLQPAATSPPNVRHLSLGIVNCIANVHSRAIVFESNLEVPRALVILNCPPSLVELAGVVLLILIVFLNT